MAPNTNIIAEINVVATTGLWRPRTSRDTPWCFWNEEGVDRLPPLIRFCWQPQTGMLYAGVQVHHALQVPRHWPYPLASYLRGYSLPEARCVALVPYSRPAAQSGREHDADLAFAFADRVVDVFLAVLKPALPAGARTFRTTDNQWLGERLARLNCTTVNGANGRYI